MVRKRKLRQQFWQPLCTGPALQQGHGQIATDMLVCIYKYIMYIYMCMQHTHTYISIYIYIDICLTQCEIKNLLVDTHDTYKTTLRVIRRLWGGLDPLRIRNDEQGLTMIIKD